MTNPYGSDLWLSIASDGSADIDPTCREVSGIGVLVQSAIMRQITPTGSLIGAPDDCTDLRALISRGMKGSDIQQVIATVRGQLLRDQRITSAVITGNFNPATATLTMVEAIESGAGPFTLTIEVGQLTLALYLNGVPIGGG
jgi:hypothetical protein